MQYLLHWIEQFGIAFVFFNVLIEQAGIPLPAYPTLVVTGALVYHGDFTAPQLVLVASLAALMADLCWYFAGRRFGRPVLRLMCKISLSPDSCVRQTESIYARWGPPALTVAKFIPGFAAIATVMAGAMRARLMVFIIYDMIGAMLWSGLAVGIGMLFHNAVQDILTTLENLGRIGLILIVIAFVLVVLYKWWQRYRVQQELKMARISVEELGALLESGNTPVILDVRGPVSQEDGRIPSAKPFADDAIERLVAELALDTELVVYCACPNDASAARMAKLLMQRGFRSVRPLAGGIDAWSAAGLALEMA